MCLSHLRKHHMSSSISVFRQVITDQKFIFDRLRTLLTITQTHWGYICRNLEFEDKRNDVNQLSDGWLEGSQRSLRNELVKE